MGPAGTDSVRLVEHRAGRVRLYLNPACAGDVSVQALVDLPGALAGLPGRATRQRGRVTSWRWQPDWAPPEGLAVRLYAHGGLLGPALGTGFLGAGRMLRELRLAIAAHARGVPTAEPVGVRVQCVCGPWVRAHYVSRIVPGALDMLSLLRSAPEDAPLSPPERRRLAHAAAAAVAALHEAGIRHGDLSLANLLVQGSMDAPRVFVIDFDKASEPGVVSWRARIGNLLRLNRSVLKWPAARSALGPRTRLRFLRAYARECRTGSAEAWFRVARRCDR
ncbi:MAG: phosphotransferase [Candidatus Brocadiaceae bacterium]|nr:phosphotransferase [Candidatus Brocadiaceae bacterium]